MTTAEIRREAEPCSDRARNPIPMPPPTAGADDDLSRLDFVFCGSRSSVSDCGVSSVSRKTQGGDVREYNRAAATWRAACLSKACSENRLLCASLCFFRSDTVAGGCSGGSGGSLLVGGFFGMLFDFWLCGVLTPPHPPRTIHGAPSDRQGERGLKKWMRPPSRRCVWRFFFISL